MDIFYSGILSFSLGVIFGTFGSNAIYYFLSFLILELIFVIRNKSFNFQERISLIGLSIFGYIISRALIQGPLFLE
jgi:hypothetical protein